MIRGGRPLAVLERVRADTPVVLHGVSLSIGSTDPLNLDYLDDLARLIARVEPAWVSDHLCWGSHGRRYAHDLLPLPYTEEAIDHVVGRVREVQDRLGRRILLENVSSYVAFRHSTMPEWAFICGRRRAGGLRHPARRQQRLRQRRESRLPGRGLPRRVFRPIGSVRSTWPDTATTGPTCSTPTTPRFAARSGTSTATPSVGSAPVPTLVEWDDHVPPIEDVLAEAERARAAEAQVLGTASDGRTATA